MKKPSSSGSIIIYALGSLSIFRIGSHCNAIWCTVYFVHHFAGHHRLTQLFGGPVRSGTRSFTPNLAGDPAVSHLYRFVGLAIQVDQ